MTFSWVLLRAVLLSLLPSSFWLWYVASSSPRRVSRPLLVLALGAGALSPLGVLGLGWLIDESHLSWMDIPDSPAQQLLFFIVCVGLVEEMVKLLAVRLTVYPFRDFAEPWDGLLYSTASALGFATTENVKYVLGFGDPSILLGRSLLSTLGHVLMSACWGYSLGLQKKDPAGHRLAALQGLAWASLGHGMYDWLLIGSHPLLAMGVLGLLFWVFRTRLEESVLESRHHVVCLSPVVECPGCRSLVRSRCRFCTACGNPLPTGLPPHCGNCLQPLGAPVCPGCGASAKLEPGGQAGQAVVGQGAGADAGIAVPQPAHGQPEGAQIKD